MSEYCKNCFEFAEKLTEKEQECEELKKTVLTKCPNCNSEYLTSKGIELYEENKKLKKECEELKKQLMQKDEVNTFFNTPIEGWSSNPCDVCESKNNYENLSEKYEALKHECEELNKFVEQAKDAPICFKCEQEPCIRQKKEKFEKALEEIEKYIKEEEWSLLDYVVRDINDIINKAKGEGTENE